jgi:ABC-2 type transport system ATP-binding protein
MPENNPLYKDMLVKDALEYVLELHGVAKEDRKKRLNEVVKATHLQGVYFRPISELSKGYKQRVGLAQVLIHDPKILILDEPTEGLDPNQRGEIRELIRKLGKERTVIVSTHVMQEVEAMCDRIVIINGGKVIADGERTEILKMKGKSNVIKLKLRSSKTKVKKEDFNEIKTKSIDIRNFNKEFYEIEIVTSDQEFFEKVNKKCQENSWIIYELSQKTQNLEDVFRELTQK